jgi:NADH-quinone oxidoreductase subunit H
VTLVYVLLVYAAQSVHFADIVTSQNTYWYATICAPFSASFLLLLLLESKRAPFDHAETESEVVAGYAVEYSGTMLLMFYLAEYLHLIIAAVHIIMFVAGGWYMGSLLTAVAPHLATAHGALTFTALIR